MRRFLIPVLFLGLITGCSSVKNLNIGPHRIDVQQGNALDQENVARLKPGLNRGQVRFLLGTPLVIDPFRTDRWDYVYVLYKGGNLAEQKNITLFFEGDTLVRIEGDIPAPTTEAQPAEPAADPVTPPAAPAPDPLAAVLPAAPAELAAVPQAEPVAPQVPASDPVSPPAVAVAPEVARAEPVPAAETATAGADGVVPPLPSPPGVPAYVDPRTPAELSLQPETDVTAIQPDVMPAFPGTESPAASNDDPVLQAVDAWKTAWASRDVDTYLAAYDASFIPQGGEIRAAWEKRRRLLLGAARNIELTLDALAVERQDAQRVRVTFNQTYRASNYRDAVTKQLDLIERDGRWLIVEEKILTVLRRVKP